MGTVRAELTCFLGLMPLLVSDWWLPWNDMAHTTDASPIGWGISSSVWGAETSASVGRTLERSRFRKTSGAGRTRALQQAGFRQRQGGRWDVMKGGEEELFAEAERWVWDGAFEEVPAALVAKDKWNILYHGRWKYEEDILALETRCLVQAVERLARMPWGHTRRAVILNDNLSLVLCAGRVRAREHRVLIHIRRMAAVCLVRNMRVCVRWVPSELNHRDSRRRVTSV